LILDETAKVFEFLSHPLRLKILCWLSKCWKKSAWEIVKSLWLAQNLVSHHLWFLKKSWLINSEKEGRNVFYSIDKKVFEKFKNDIDNIFYT